MDCNMNRNLEIGDAPNVVNPLSEDDVDPHLKRETACDAEAQNPQDTTNVATPEPLFKGDIVCFQEVFEWLSLEDIHSVGQTCKRLQAIAGDFFRTYLQAANLVCCNEGIRIIPGGLLNGFSAVAQKVAIEGDDSESYRYIQSNCKSLKRIDFREAVITASRAKQIASILNKVEIIQLTNCQIKGDFYNCFLKFCSKLKHLIVDDEKPENILIGTDNLWLNRNYPKLKHVELNVLFYSKMNEIPEFTTFFKCNPQIQSFATDLNGLLHLRHSLKQSQIQLRNLAVAFDEFCSTVDEDAAIFLLGELHDQRTFNRLHIYDNRPQDYGPVLPVRILEKMLLRCYNLCNIITDLSLKEFDPAELSSGTRITDVKMIAESLLCLERLNIFWIGFNDILSFVQRSVDLKVIAIKYFDGDTVDLPTLNEARGKLFGAERVTIYVGEKVFLATKWASKTINLEFIELRRIDTYEWVHYLKSPVL